MAKCSPLLMEGGARGRMGGKAPTEYKPLICPRLVGLAYHTLPRFLPHIYKSVGILCRQGQKILNPTALQFKLC